MGNRLENRVSIVTGAARGMGYAIAKALYDEGARVAVIDIDAEAVSEAALSLDPDSARVMGRQVDVTGKEQVLNLTREVTSAWGGIDILVNNAGGALFTPHILAEIEEKDWNLVVDVNLKGVFLFCHAAIPAMQKQGRGAIVNISALAAHWRSSLAGVQYTAAKAGVEGLTRQLAYDWAQEATCPQDLIDRHRKKFIMGPHKAYQLACEVRWADIYIYSMMSPELVRTFFLNPLNDLIAIEALLANLESIAVFPQATHTLPILPGQQQVSF